MNLQETQKLMGHKNLNTTLPVYAKIITNDCTPNYDKIMKGW
jgi:integrase